MRKAGPVRSRAFSFLETCAVIALLSTFAGALLAGLLYYQELAEKTTVELTLLNVRSGIRFEIADKMIHGRTAELDRVLDSNPVNWLENAPPGYVGELVESDIGRVNPGEWFYDRERRQLAYVPKRALHLKLESSTDRALRWRIRGVRSGRGDVEDLSIVSVNRYTWFQ